MFLTDTNIFLEILLKQAKSEVWKEFLEANNQELAITDFSLHSIGVILFKKNHEDLFLKLISDTLTKVRLISLPEDGYDQVVRNREKFGLDFDDSYQFSVCKNYGYTLVTFDQDFKGIKGIDILFL